MLALMGRSDAVFPWLASVRRFHEEVNLGCGRCFGLFALWDREVHIGVYALRQTGGGDCVCRYMNAHWAGRGG